MINTSSESPDSSKWWFGVSHCVWINGSLDPFVMQICVSSVSCHIMVHHYFMCTRICLFGTKVFL